MEQSDIVESLSGRDKGKYFFVVSLTQEYVLLADGKCRKLEHPKRKSHKHVRLVAHGTSRVAAMLRSGDKVLNSDLRRELAEFCQKSTSQNQGG